MRVYKCWTRADWIRKALSEWLSTLATLLKPFVLMKIRMPFKIPWKTLMKARRGGKWQSRVPSPSGGVLNRGTNTISYLSTSVSCSRTVNDITADVFLPSQVNSQRETETRAQRDEGWSSRRSLNRWRNIRSSGVPPCRRPYLCWRTWNGEFVRHSSDLMHYRKSRKGARWEMAQETNSLQQTTRWNIHVWVI